MIKLAIVSVALLCFGGCGQQPKIKSVPQPQIAQKPLKSAIKGIITELTYTNDQYCYTIVASDTTNAKLPNANFCGTKFYHNKGDLVYATFVGDKIESMLLIREAVKTSPKAVQKTRKNIKTKIEVPQEQSINF